MNQISHATNEEPGVGSPLADRWLFLSKFMKQGTAIAAVAPSSRWLARAVVAGIDFARAECIVELGAGTGPVTERLVGRSPSSRVVVLERDPEFCRRLRRRFPTTEVVEADVANLAQVLDERGVHRVDHFLSGLPLPSFPPTLRDGLLETVSKRLAAQGTFRQLTHMPWVYYPLYCRYFDHVEFRLVWRNLPPGGVYICRDWRGISR
jgi:phospholipid N-methyltransferase